MSVTVHYDVCSCNWYTISNIIFVISCSCLLSFTNQFHILENNVVKIIETHSDSGMDGWMEKAQSFQNLPTSCSFTEESSRLGPNTCNVPQVKNYQSTAWLLLQGCWSWRAKHHGLENTTTVNDNWHCY